MKISRNEDKSILFSTTEIPDIFFTEYLSCASGDFIKIYLCLVFLAKYDKDIRDYPIKLLDDRIAELERKIAELGN